MAIVHDLNKICDWLQANVCDKVQLKLPDDDNGGDGYAYELVNPTAFRLFTPTKDHLPPAVKAPIPSLCLRLKEGQHTRDGNSMQLIINFCAWNPGIHTADVFEPTDEKNTDVKSYNQRVTGAFRRSVDGWQDVFSFMDTALRVLENAVYIADMRLDVDSIKYGMTSDKDGLDEFYPYWLGWIELTVYGGNIRNQSTNVFL